MRPKNILIFIGFALISVIWGSTWLVIKIGLQSIPPFYSIAIRFSLASLILFAIIRFRNENIPFDRKSLRLYLNLAVLSFSFPFMLVYYGEQYIASGLASVLFGVYPFVVAIGSHLLLPEERLNGYKILGLILAFLGILIIFWDDLGSGANQFYGMLAILGSTLLQGISLVTVKRMKPQVSPIVMSFGGMLLSIIIIAPVAILSENFSAINLDLRGAGSIIYLGTFGTVVTFVIYYWLMKHIEIVYLSLTSFITPILAIILGAIVMDERLSSRISLGALIVLTGILIANWIDLKGILQRLISSKE